MKYSKPTDLKYFLNECEKELLNDKNRIAVEYPHDTISRCWDSGKEKITLDSGKVKFANGKLLKSISGSANVYAIFISDKGSSKYDLVYIGQTNSKGARTRLTNHLIEKHEETGAKLNNVLAHIGAGGKLSIAWIPIDPASLRHYIEEELIKKHKHQLKWNKHGTQEA